MNIAVVYFSLEGNTRFIAEKISDNLSADLIELRPQKAYPTGNFSKYFWGGKSASFKETPELKHYDFKKNDYDLVILGMPLWAWQVTPPIRTFLKENDLKDKKVAAFISCAGGDPTKAYAELKNLIGGQELVAGMTLVNPLNSKEDVEGKVEEFCKGLTV